MSKRLRRDASHPQLAERLRKRARKAWRPGHARQVRERAGTGRVKRRTRRHRFGAKRRCRGNPLSGKTCDRDASGNLRQAVARDADRRTALDSYPACEIVRRAARGANDRDRLVGGKLSEKGCGGFETRRGGCCLDDAE